MPCGPPGSRRTARIQPQKKRSGQHYRDPRNTVEVETDDGASAFEVTEPIRYIPQRWVCPVEVSQQAKYCPNTMATRLNVKVNSDNPTMFETSLREECRELMR